MEELEFPISARQMGRVLSASTLGDPDRLARHLAPLSNVGEGALSFCGSAKFAEKARVAEGAIILTREEWAGDGTKSTYIFVSNPQSVFAQLAKRFAPQWSQSGISPLAHIDPGAQLADGVSVGPYAVIEGGVSVGEGSFVGPHTVIGAGSSVGSHCRLHPRVTVFPRVTIGNRVQVFPGTVLGSDGFGLFTEAGGLSQMPQIGTVVIEDDVRIGANCTIDRATFGETRIGKGVQIDNLVHVAHNCTVKENTILCAQVGIAGSATIEANSILAGQVGVSHGITIGKGARVAAQSGIAGDLPGEESYLGSPAVPLSESYRTHLYSRRLADLFKRVRALENLFTHKPTSQNDSSTRSLD